MKILALETCGEYCSVALWIDGDVYERHVASPARHTEVLLPLCEALRSESGIALAQLDGIAFGAGPGAFTGVRVAASAAHGIAMACDLPLAPISSLAALARGGWRCNTLRCQLALLDARRHEVYWGFYALNADGSAYEVLHADCVTAPAQVVISATRPWGAVGRGFEILADAERARLAPDAFEITQCLFPRAGDVAALAATELRAGRGVSAEHALPVYLRAAL
jgi:tRNA threonylcarbamoyladenosine biosynthesis protein TsaB